jgi:hypothetical protein
MVQDHQGYGLKLRAAHGGTNFKELCNALEMETETKMENWLQKLLFDCFNDLSM